jgi:hypothetical protein
MFCCLVSERVLKSAKVCFFDEVKCWFGFLV